MKKLWAFVLVLGVIAVGSGAAAASTDLPFHLDGSGTIVAGGTQSGEIVGTQIGQGTASGTFTVFGAILPCSSGSTVVNTLASQTLTAADGATINQQLVGITCSSGPTSFRTTSTYTITGGTGRFIAATGTGTHVRYVDFPNGTGAPGTFTISQDGTINLNNN
jgi:hypothetical protein